MNGIRLQVTYNLRSHRWEIWRKTSPLPEATHPSRDAAMILAVHLLLKEWRRGRVLVADETGTPATILEVRRCNSGAGKSKPVNLARKVLPEIAKIPIQS